jgi:hypothetical protein
VCAVCAVSFLQALRRGMPRQQQGEEGGGPATDISSSGSSNLGLAARGMQAHRPRMWSSAQPSAASLLQPAFRRRSSDGTAYTTAGAARGGGEHVPSQGPAAAHTTEKTQRALAVLKVIVGPKGRLPPHLGRQQLRDIRDSADGAGPQVLAKLVKQRNKLLQEIVSTEQIYHERMILMQTHYFGPLAGEGGVGLALGADGTPLMDSSTLKKVFSNMAKVSRASSFLWGKLNAAWQAVEAAATDAAAPLPPAGATEEAGGPQAQPPVVSSLPLVRAFVEALPTLRWYVEYSCNFKTAHNTLHELVRASFRQRHSDPPMSSDGRFGEAEPFCWDNPPYPHRRRKWPRDGGQRIHCNRFYARHRLIAAGR